MIIAVLALQGAFIEHEQRLRALGAEVFEIRQRADWDSHATPTGRFGVDFDGLVIPGGESTTMSKLLVELNLMAPVRSAIAQGMPVLGTCAGLILLSKTVPDNHDREMIGTMNITARRNAYGRQLGSFHTVAPMTFPASEDNGGEVLIEVPMTFIRAPYIAEVGPGVRVLAEVDGRIVAAQQGRQLATAFHPELDADTHLHEYFLTLC